MILSAHCIFATVFRLHFRWNMKRRLHEVYEKKKISSYIEQFSSLLGERNPGCFRMGKISLNLLFYFVLGWRWYNGGAALYDERLWCCWWYYLLIGAGVFAMTSRPMSFLKIKWRHCLRGGKWALSFGMGHIWILRLLYTYVFLAWFGEAYISGRLRTWWELFLFIIDLNPRMGLAINRILHIGHAITLNCKTT